MSVRRRATWWWLLLGAAGVAMAEEEMPDMDFIEYLGMWEESDDVWLALVEEDESIAADADERIDPVPQGEESRELDDEG